MATYLKRTSKLFDLSLSRTSAEVNLRDLMCPVCRGILIEPVTLPCTHNLCLRCLKGTFEHNSLSCPLCRVRVGSWLRTATKSETLVNNGLWELIRTRFPKEVQGKNNGDEEDLELDSDFTAKKILSAAGEIRKEYEAQLQMAEEEMRREREAERIASEVLIRKIQAEEREQLAQLAQDQLLAKTLAKRNSAGKEKGSAKYYEESLRTSQDGALDANAERTKYISKLPAVPRGENSRLEDEKASSVKLKEGSESRKSNIALISKIRAERYASSAKGSTSGTCRTSPDKFCFQKSMPVHNAVTRTLKHQVVTKMTHPSCSSYAPEPGCSGSKIYGTQSKEELHVPSDVLTSKKKSLGVEICMTTNVDDERIGSAESAGSHDSINQEIHHFKPIKAMPRTPLKMSSDGRQIDPKLIRVIAMIKRIPNAVPKPPSPTPLKRTLGCSWSAFRGKVKQDLRLKERPSNQQKIEDEEDVKPSTSLVQSQSISGKQVKLQVSDTVRRLDLDPEVSFDSNKNYAKNINRIINGTKVSKKLILDETAESGKVGKSWKAQVRNGTIAKSRRRKNSWSDRKHVEHAVESRVVNEDESTNDTGSPNPANVHAKDEKPGTSRDEQAVENIAERIKKRKLNIGKEASTSLQNSAAADVDACQRGTRGRKPLKKRNVEDAITTGEPCSSGSEGRLKRKAGAKTLSRPKRQKISARANAENTSKSVASPSDASSDSDTSVVDKLARNNYPGNKRVTRNATKITNGSDVAKRKYRESTSTNDSLELGDGSKTNDRASENDRFGSDRNVDGSALDEEVIAEQKRIERLVQQEKEDFELAQRLQAKFNEMGRIAGRTRGSRRALENEIIEQILPKVDERKAIGKGNTIHTAKRVSNDQTPSGQTDKRRKVQRRVLK